MLFHERLEQKPVDPLGLTQIWIFRVGAFMKAVKPGAHVDAVVVKPLACRLKAFFLFGLSQDEFRLVRDRQGHNGEIHGTSPGMA